MVLFMEGAVGYDYSCNYAILCKWSILPLASTLITVSSLQVFYEDNIWITRREVERKWSKSLHMGCEWFKIVKLNPLRTSDPSMIKYGALLAVDFL